MTASPVLNSASGSVLRSSNTTPVQGGDNFLIGQMINIKVQQRLDEQHYVVMMRGESRKVVSERALPVGETIDAVVVRVTDKLELRQVAAGSTLATGPAEEASPADYSDMRSVASFYKCNFSSKELAMLQAAVNQAVEAEPMALAGLLLNKRGVPIHQELLHALCALQAGTDPVVIATIQSEVGIDIQNGEPTVSTLAQLMCQALSGNSVALQSEAKEEQEVQETTNSVDVALTADLAVQGDAAPVIRGSSFSDASNDNPHSSARIIQLLNDVDAEGLGVRYGTLPVLIDGRLVELELMLFQHRPRDTIVEPVRRLVMSVHTSTLGTVQITAEALNNRLLIQISSESTEQAEALATYADEISDLAKRFGWALDSIGYEVRTQGGRLAQRVIEHGVRQGAVDNVW